MKSKLSLLFPLLVALFSATAPAAEPLRVFIRGGQKTHGPGAHEHEQFLRDYSRLLTGRGMKVDGALAFPTDTQLAQTDVLVMYSQDGGDVPAAQRAAFESFLKRGGGLVVIHTATVPPKATPDGAAYWKSIIGGSWAWGATKWLEGPMALYYVDRTHPITDSVANFDLNDEIYYDLDMSPSAHVLAAAYTPNVTSTRRNNQLGQPAQGKVSVYDIAPQMWVYENQLAGGQPYRAFVSIPGHLLKTFSLPHYRAVLLRGIAWAGKRPNVDEFNTPDDLATLRYPEGGPARPEKSLAQLVVHPDFKVSLAASEPLINKAMNLDWDAQGRMWVAETPEYPDGRRVNPGTDYVQRWQQDDKLTDDGLNYNRPAHDRISILTAPDANGTLTKKQVFYEGLERVTSFVLHKDGVIASAAPDIWLLRDTDGDGRADKAEKLYTNLGDKDTHAVINNLRWGFDGWIYATHGYSSSPHVMSGDGRKDFGNIGSGVVRFKPDGSAFEQYSSKGGNTWGLQIAWDNEVFWTQPTSGDLLLHTVMSEEQLSRGGARGLASFQVVHKSTTTYPLIPYDQLPYVQIDWVGKFTAAAGCAIYDGGSWPAPWNYSYFTTEPTINIVHHEIVRPQGVSYVGERAPGREEIEFIAGKDYWFRPIETRIGPDGALYVIDFYNQAVIHNDTRGPKHGPHNAAIRPDRDHYYARIWRVDHKDAKKLTVPDLSKASPLELVKALETVNQHVRMNAVRLLVENNPPAAAPALRQLVASQKSPQSRVAALWALNRIGQLDAGTIAAAANDGDETVRKNAMMAAVGKPDARASALRLVKDPNPRVRLEALNALAAQDADAATAQALVAIYPALEDGWSKAAFMGVAAKSPALFLTAAFAGDAKQNGPLVAQLTGLLVTGGNANEAAKLVIALADKPAAVDDLKQSMLATFSTGLRGALPAWTPELQQAMQKLISSPNARVAAAALPLAVRWDAGGTLAPAVKREVDELITALGDKGQADDTRAGVAKTLLGVRQASPAILPAVAQLLGAGSSAGLQTRVVEAFGDFPEPEIGSTLAAALPGLGGEAQAAALNQLLKRAAWSMALLDALDGGKVPPAVLGPANVHRLRLHPDAKVAARANALIDKLRGPEAKEKDALIAKFTPEVEKPGNVAKGRELFTVNCATCHQFGNLGNLVGPALTGMGAHGPAELLVSILDPNKEVDFSFVAWSIETKDGETYDGVISRENNSLVALRNAAGEKEILKTTIKSRRNTGRSLMPEGFEALGAENLRDILAFICADDARFRFVDLGGAFTASSRAGLYASDKPDGGSLPLAKYGIINALGVPFKVVDPAKNPAGKNLMVLRGGPENSHSKRAMPKMAEAKMGFAAKQLHILGNVGGWAFPFGGEKSPVLKITAHYAGGAKEELVFKNGEEFADYIREVDVPGSKLAGGIAADGRQVRLASRRLTGGGIIEKLTFESFDNQVAPTTLAVTADLSAEPLPAAPQSDVRKKAAPAAPLTWGAGTRALLLGGGSAHDFNKWFNEADTATLKAAGFSVNYTEAAETAAAALKDVPVLVWSANRAELTTPEVRAALNGFLNAGKGLVIVHAGAWYNFKDWPEFNRDVVCGGARGHDAPAEFSVNTVNAAHPVMRGLPASFKITDELYYVANAADGPAVEVLAKTSPSRRDGTQHPSVWLVKHPRARIVCIALGHDGRAHELPEFRQLLTNAASWAAGK